MTVRRLSSVRLDLAGSGRIGKVKVFFTARMYTQQPSTERRYFDAVHDVNDPKRI